MDKSNIRAIAFYLPQYHPIPENDEWWGKGFTDWNNVAKARPLFFGHYQPHVPAELGYYDLRDRSVMERQAALAKEYGIYGFCYYHYWFDGRRLLEQPIQNMIISGKPDFPFCLCWANENWTRNWDGMKDDVLLEQHHSEEDDRRHIQYLAGIFHDKRYIRIGGKPLFLVYRASEFPDPKKTASIWREEARRLGIGEIYLCKVESFVNDHSSPQEITFDASIEFQPDWLYLGKSLRRSRFWQIIRKAGLSSMAYADNKIYEYSAVAERMMAKPKPSYVRYPCVMPSWDNSPRRNTSAAIMRNATPKIYKRWLKSAIEKHMLDGSGDKLIFINAWNEWGEGTHLEPCCKWGRAYLEATREAIMESGS